MRAKLLKKSLQVGKLAGIPIQIHWTFTLFVGFILYVAVRNGFSPSDTLWFLAFVFILFGFVILHELGHAIAAKRFGIDTRDITISPIGGIARLETLPEKAMQELIVAVAGPLVNVVLALFFLFLLLPHSYQFLPESERMNLLDAPVDYLRYLLLINISLVIFNLIPALPMDGGRIFRALLSLMIDRAKATYIASIVAKIIALTFFGIGIYYGHFILAIIGAFVFYMSGSEYSNIVIDKILNHSTAGEALLQHSIFLKPEMLFKEIVHLKIPEQSSYLVFDKLNNPVGSLPKSFIKHVKDKNLEDRSINDFMSKGFGTMHKNTRLKTIFCLMNKHGWAIVDVLSHDHQSIGVIDRTSLERFVESKKKDSGFQYINNKFQHWFFNN